MVGKKSCSFFGLTFVLSLSAGKKYIQQKKQVVAFLGLIPWSAFVIATFISIDSNRSLLRSKASKYLHKTFIASTFVTRLYQALKM